MSHQTTLAIVGGGASGLMAALSAAVHRDQNRGNFSILLLEKEPRVGRKLLATGNGRCNLSHANASPRHYHGLHPDFCRHALTLFGPSDTVDFLKQLGLICRVEEGGLTYPYGEQASAVLDCLRFACQRKGVTIQCDAFVEGIRLQKEIFVLNLASGSIPCQSVILAAGGLAAPQLGAGDWGYRLAKNLGHSCTALFPALVPIRTDPALTRPLKGVRVKGEVSLKKGDQLLRAERGEVQFSDGFLSGISVMQLSRLASQHKQTRLVLDFMPDYSMAQVQRLVRQTQILLQREPAERLLTGLINKRVGQTLVKQVVPLTRPIGEISPIEREEIARRIKGWEFPVLGVGPWKSAQVTAGGLDTAQFDPFTMESRLVGGFYATGEVLDVDGDCGGFNLQWAWSSGYLAGRSAAQSLGGGKKHDSHFRTNASVGKK